jgi:uncharacterized protein (TIGR03086 family)
MDSLDLLQVADHRLMSLVEVLEEPDLALPTPCASWDVRALLSHVVATIDAFSDAVDGAGGPTEAELFSGADRVGSDPVGVTHATVDRAHRAWSSVTDWDASLTTVLGPMPAVQAISIVTYSNLLHSWDLGNALGRRVEFDDSEAQLAEAVGGRLVPAMRPGLFGPEVSISETASATERVVAFSGRHPF